MSITDPQGPVLRMHAAMVICGVVRHACGAVGVAPKTTAVESLVTCKTCRKLAERWRLKYGSRPGVASAVPPTEPTPLKLIWGGR